ncbi:hypothetical protein NCCP2716_19980 [Sporosarcina sp. NCCP-2716]|uniref:DUF2269 family protein n=1 Tax=Sporosarcina sp. NCCP-2716 TaxID=2943679 RepID=UPI002041B958|nr:DUF2269 family protein [Sporosarcina sp. NCCP-2716]GKV69500.1 hypothetical protein NCCP2716_19980 [Sporosarcina sp. NCCP-2716]
MGVFYAVIVYLHVLSAVVSVGPLFVLFPIIRRMRSAAGTEDALLISLFKWTIRFVMHSGHVLVVTGILLLLIGPWPWYTSWVIVTVGVMMLSIVFLASGFSKVLKRFPDEPENREALIATLSKTSWRYILLLLVMLYLMVAKPAFW